jgi:AraC-like DNA-binding protein
MEKAVSKIRIDRPEKLAAKLHRAEDFISCEPGNTSLRPSDTGVAVGVSRRALYHPFRQVGHTSNELRPPATAAAGRMRSSKTRRLTITSIAHDLGFADPTHFSRLSRGQYGMSPRKGRRHRIRRIGTRGVVSGTPGQVGA